MSAFLYLARASVGGLRIAKIGVSGRPKVRLTSIFAASPLSMTECLLKRFQARGEADAWEKHIVCAANRYKPSGEWVLDDELLADLWAGVSGGEDVAFGSTFPGRPVPKTAPQETRRAAFAQRFRDRVGPVSASKVNYDGHPTLFNRAVIMARLLEGYGADDIAVLDEIDPCEVRREIQRMRAKGQLATIYSTRKASA